MSALNARQGILSLVVKDKPSLYSAYMPFVKNGGVFVPTPKRYFLGDEVFVLLTLPDSAERLPVAGKVVWTSRHPDAFPSDGSRGQERREHIYQQVAELLENYPPAP